MSKPADSLPQTSEAGTSDELEFDAFELLQSVAEGSRFVLDLCCHQKLRMPEGTGSGCLGESRSQYSWPILFTSNAS